MTASYAYNADGKRVKVVVTIAEVTKTTAFVGDYFEISVGPARQVTPPTPPDFRRQPPLIHTSSSRAIINKPITI